MAASFSGQIQYRAKLAAMGRSYKAKTKTRHQAGFR
jgi:hypothetical protein